MEINIANTERKIIAIYRGVNTKGKKYILDMLDIVMHHCMKSNGSSNVYDLAEWEQNKSNGGEQIENQGYIYGEGAQ